MNERPTEEERQAKITEAAPRLMAALKYARVVMRQHGVNPREIEALDDLITEITGETP
jgi:hypothetical protein